MTCFILCLVNWISEYSVVNALVLGEVNPPPLFYKLSKYLPQKNTKIPLENNKNNNNNNKNNKNNNSSNSTKTDIQLNSFNF